MQKLSVEFKNTPGDAPQVPCSVSGALNREETLSVPRTVLADNISEEDLLSGKRGQDLRVPVINMQNQLIPEVLRTVSRLKYLLVWIRLKILFLLYNFKICEVGNSSTH